MEFLTTDGLLDSMKWSYDNVGAYHLLTICQALFQACHVLTQINSHKTLWDMCFAILIVQKRNVSQRFNSDS